MKNWPHQSAPYRSALPGVAAYGLDLGSVDLPSKFYFITSDEDALVGGPDPRGPNCFSGTGRWCWTQDQGAGFHKFVFPDIGGYIYTGRRITGPAGRGNFDYIGHSAPGAGLFWRCTGLRLGGGSNQRVWHLGGWLGDEPSAPGVTNFPATFRDAFGASQDKYLSTDFAMINSEARLMMDEGMEVFYSMDRFSFIRCGIYDPLHSPPDFAMPAGSHHEAGVDHGYGMLLGGSDFNDHSVVTQCVFAHTTDRNPTTATNNHAHINNLHYNHGRPGGGRGAGCKIQDLAGFNIAAGKTMQVNVVGNVTVMGPEQLPTKDQLPVLAEVVGIVPAGSTGHAALNSQFGWAPVVSQDAFFRTFPEGYLKPTLRQSAWHAGLGFDYAGVLKPCADPEKPTMQEGLDFVDLMSRTVGVMPARRYLYCGGLSTVFNDIADAIRGVPSGPQYINTVAECGKWPEMPRWTYDPANPLEWHHAPIPLGPDRDEILTEGTFSNGASKVGYTKIWAWIIEQYLYVMGR